MNIAVRTDDRFVKVDGINIRYLEEGSGVQPACALKYGLLAAQCFGESMDYVRRHQRRILGQYRAALHLDGVDGSFAANSATGTGIEVPFQPLEVYFGSGIQLHRYGVGRLPGIAGHGRAANAMDLMGAL